MKTVHELNQKWWYRLIKVLFIVWVVLVLLVAIGAIISEYAPQFDETRSYVYCNDSEFTGFLPKDVGVFVYSDYISYYDDQTFRGLCNGVVTKNTDGTLQVKRGPAPTLKNYTFQSKYTSRDWTRTILYSMGAIIAILLTFELIRRVFYYIVLGSIRPRKTID